MGECFDNFDRIEKHIENLNLLWTTATFDVKNIIIDIYPNSRIAYLATHGSKKTQKKNFHRAIKTIKIMEKTRHEN